MTSHDDGRTRYEANGIQAPSPPGLPGTYAELTQLLPPRPIHSEAELDRAHEMIGRLVGFALNEDQEDYLEALAIFVEAYEAVHWPIDTSHITPLDSLKFLLEENDMTASDLGRLLGNRSLGSAILTGRRQLSKAHILTLAERFKVEPSLFLKPDGPARRQKRLARSGKSLRGTRGSGRMATRYHAASRQQPWMTPKAEAIGLSSEQRPA